MTILRPSLSIHARARVYFLCDVPYAKRCNVFQENVCISSAFPAYNSAIYSEVVALRIFKGVGYLAWKRPYLELILNEIFCVKELLYERETNMSTCFDFME